MKMRGVLCLVVCLLVGCRGRGVARAESQAASPADAAHPWRKPGDKIDSLLPMNEYLRRFRAGLVQPARLEGGAASRNALARAFVAAVSRRDSARLLGLLVSREEFAWLVFPDHLYARPPYELDPEIMWLRMDSESGKGLGRVLQRLGGQPLVFQSVACQRDTLQMRSGPARVWSSCVVRYRVGDSVQTRRLFGSMIERDGRVKLLSFANGF
jgi:hypothetical protein